MNSGPPDHLANILPSNQPSSPTKVDFCFGHSHFFTRELHSWKSWVWFLFQNSESAGSKVRRERVESALCGKWAGETLSIHKERMFLKSIPSITPCCHCSFLALLTITYQVELETGITLHTYVFTHAVHGKSEGRRSPGFVSFPCPKDGSADVLPKGGMLWQLPEGRQSSEKNQTPSDSSKNL